MKPALLLIDGKSKHVRRFLEGKPAEKAVLPDRQDEWIHADIELFRVYGPRGVNQDTTFDPKVPA